MAERYSTLCAMCDEDQVDSYHCSNCQKSMCAQCYSFHRTVCKEDAPVSPGASGGGHRSWGRSTGYSGYNANSRHASAPRFRGDDSQDDVRTRLEELSAYIEEMVVKNNAVEIKASAMQEENSSLRQDLRSAHDNNAQLLLDFREMQREHSTLQREVRTMQREMDELRDKNFTLSEDVATLKAEMVKSTAQVAFHARLANHITASGQLYIICGDVLTNVGGGYDPQTGIFTATVPGTYVFTATASSNTAGSLFYIDLDGTNIASPYSGFANQSTTCQVTVKLVVGQKVSMKAISSYYFQGTAQQSWTSFSGMLVQPDL